VLNSGQNLENADVSRLEIRGSGVTVRNVKVDGSIVVYGDNVMIDRVTMQHVGISSASNVTVQHADIGYGSQGIHLTSDRGSMARDVVLRNNYVHHPQPNEGDHYDGIQVRGVDGLLIECSVFDLGAYQDTYTAAVYLENANGNNADVRVLNNWLLGGGYIVHMSSDTVSAQFTGNRFGGQARWGICYPSNPANLTASGNTAYADGDPVDLKAECR
jgi:Right handed beta helix region